MEGVDFVILLFRAGLQWLNTHKKRKKFLQLIFGG